MATSHLNLPYHPESTSLTLDLHLPPQPFRPLVVWVHGGGWRSGSPKGGPALRLVDRGFGVASLSYTFSQEALFPRQVEDVLMALRWLKDAAPQFGFDGNSYVLWGHSAGGHLAAWLGALRGYAPSGVWPPPLLRVQQESGILSGLKGVVDFCGPTHFLAMDLFPGALSHHAPDSPESQLVGGPIADRVELVTLANPLTFVNPGSAPFLICHGDGDLFVPIDQSRRLFSHLQGMGIPCELVEISGGGHVFKTTEIMNKIEAFIGECLSRT